MLINPSPNTTSNNPHKTQNKITRNHFIYHSKSPISNRGVTRYQTVIPTSNSSNKAKEEEQRSDDQNTKKNLKNNKENIIKIPEFKPTLSNNFILSGSQTTSNSNNN